MAKERKWSSRAVPTTKFVIPRPKEAKTPTDLYFIETECAERHIKIGIASNVASRIASMQSHCPYRLRLLKMVPGAAHLEQELHMRFVADRLHGEWFRRSDELLDVIDSLEGITDLNPPKAPTTLAIDDFIGTWKLFTEIGEEEWARRNLEKHRSAEETEGASR